MVIVRYSRPTDLRGQLANEAESFHCIWLHVCVCVCLCGKVSVHFEIPKLKVILRSNDLACSKAIRISVELWKKRITTIYSNVRGGDCESGWAQKQKQLIIYPTRTLHHEIIRLATTYGILLRTYETTFLWQLQSETLVDVKCHFSG